MAIFQKSVIKKHLNNLDKEQVEKAYLKFKSNYNPAKIEQIKTLKEEEYQDGFLRDIFVDVFGYTLRPDENYNLQREFKNQSDGKKADGAILKDEKAIAVIELKSTKTKDLTKVTQQAFNYKNNQPECKYVITSNFQKLRFYIDYANEYEEFDLFYLGKEDFELLYLLLNKKSIFDNLPLKLKEETKFHEQEVSSKLYKDYSHFKRKLYENLTKNHPETDKLTLFKKSQKLLDRFLFILFAEDSGLLPPNSISSVIETYSKLIDLDAQKPLYDIFKQYFGYMNIGRKGKTNSDDIPAYNGGLFYTDDLLDNLKIDDNILIDDLRNLSEYDFNTEIDVNILGHIFEHSLNEIEEITAEIEGTTTDKTKSKRKKDGVFYTPKYITQYIVENTIGTLCNEKRIALDIEEIEFDGTFRTKTGKLSEKGKKLYNRLKAYKDWLISLKIIDPACGSGAFLNQALNFLIEEHTIIDDIIAELTNTPLRLFDVDKSILENNLFGVDINEESVEIAQLSLWLRTAQKGRKLSNLNNNIKCGNSLISDPEIAGDKAFNWNIEFKDIMDNGGFDCVIGNPPYVRQELFKEIKPYLKETYKCYNSIADLYTYFIEKGIDLMSERGKFSFILPNKFLKATYGKQIRKVIKDETNIELIFDFDDYPVFDDATTYPIVYVLNKKNIKSDFFIYSEINKRDYTNDPISLLEQKKHKVSYKSLTGEMWNFIPINTANLLKKISSNAITLSTLVEGKINRGVLTGKNEVFIFDSFLKDNLLRKNANRELIKPILLGSAIKRYNINFSNDYLLFTRRGIEIDKFPVIKEYLSEYYEVLKPRNKGEKIGRKAGPYKWFEIQDNIAYYEDFEQVKIVYPRTNNQCNFQLDTKGYFLSDNNFYIKSGNKSLLGILNSKVVFFYLKNICTTLQGGYYDFRRDKIDTIPLPLNNENNHIEELVDIQIQSHSKYSSTQINFTTYLKSQFSIEKLSKKLQNWHKLDFAEFIKELNKAIKKVGGEKLTKTDEMDWMDVFETKKLEAQTLKTKINKIDKEIDQMVYALYGLNEEEIKIVEGC